MAGEGLRGLRRRGDRGEKGREGGGHGSVVFLASEPRASKNFPVISVVEAKSLRGVEAGGGGWSDCLCLYLERDDLLGKPEGRVARGAAARGSSFSAMEAVRHPHRSTDQKTARRRGCRWWREAGGGGGQEGERRLGVGEGVSRPHGAETPLFGGGGGAASDQDDSITGWTSSNLFRPQGEFHSGGRGAEGLKGGSSHTVEAIRRNHIGGLGRGRGDDERDALGSKRKRRRSGPGGKEGWSAVSKAFLGLMALVLILAVGATAEHGDAGEYQEGSGRLEQGDVPEIVISSSSQLAPSEASDRHGRREERQGERPPLGGRGGWVGWESPGMEEVWSGGAAPRHVSARRMLTV